MSIRRRTRTPNSSDSTGTRSSTPWNSAEKKKALLAAGPVTKQLRAVRSASYVVVPFPATEAGVRTVAAAAQLATGLGHLEIAPR